MERSLGVRLGRPFGPALAARGRGGSARAARQPARRGRLVFPLGLRQSALARLSRFLLSRVLLRRRLRIALIAMLVAAPLLGGGWLWLRDSPLVAIEHVQVRGVSSTPGAQGAQIEAALLAAARGMSTLDLDTQRLRAAVASFPIVRSVRARPSFPHGLRIEVLEQPPVAALLAAGTRTALAADGIVLGPRFLSGSLPAVNDLGGNGVLPAIGGSVRGEALRATLAVLGVAPAPFAKLATRAYFGPKGLTVVLRGGLLAYFGDAYRAHAKWLSLVSVLADPSSADAAYIDVRLPERPAAGFAPGTAHTTGSSETAATSASDPATAAELASSLNSAVGASASGGPTESSASGASGGSSSTGQAASSPASPAESGGTGSASAEASHETQSEGGSSGGSEAGAATATSGG